MSWLHCIGLMWCESWYIWWNQCISLIQSICQKRDQIILAAVKPKPACTEKKITNPVFPLPLLYPLPLPLTSWLSWRMISQLSPPPAATVQSALPWLQPKNLSQNNQSISHNNIWHRKLNVNHISIQKSFKYNFAFKYWFRLTTKLTMDLQPDIF